MSRVSKSGNAIRFGCAVISSSESDGRGRSISSCGHRLKVFVSLPSCRLFTVWLQIAAICLFLAASLRADAAPVGISGIGDSSIASPGVASCYALGGGQVPAHGRQEHVQCCIFCNASGRDLSALFLGPIFSVAYDFAPATHPYVVYAIVSEPGPLDFGWTSAWSSRAPPSFL
jgi:hypothetical protein